MLVLKTWCYLPVNFLWWSLVKFLLWSLLFFLLLSWQLFFYFFFTALIIFSFSLLWKYYTFRFWIDEKNIIISSGLITTKLVSIPFKSVQSFNANSGLLQQLFNLSTINIWSASLEQMKIQNGNSHNQSSGQLWLDSSDALQLQNLIQA